MIHTAWLRRVSKLITLVSFVGLSGMAMASYPARDTMAEHICSLVQAQPKFDYNSLFAPELKKHLSQSVVTLMLQNAFKANGPCLQVHLNSENNQASYYFLEFQDHHSADLVLTTNSAGLVTQFSLGGDLPPQTIVTVTQNMVPMRDGVRLRTVIFQRNDGTKKPVLIERTPYLYTADGGTPYCFLYSALARHYVNDGYAYVIQAIRGTGGSQGVFKFLNPQEADDGYDSVMWAAHQNFSDDKVGILGGSYDGFTAMAAATANPPPLKVVVASSYMTDLRNYGANMNGVFFLFNLQWLNYAVLGQGSQGELLKPLTSDVVKRLLSVPNIAKYDQLLYGKTIPEWQKMAAHYPNMRSSFWQRRSILKMLPQIRVPTYHLAGMDNAGDGDARDTVRGFEYIEHHGGLKGLHHLIIGFWPHPAMPQMIPYLGQRADKWFAHYLKGAPLAPEPAVQVVSEPNPRSITFISGGQYPLPQLPKHKFYLVGDQQLSTRPPIRQNQVTYEMDPKELDSAFLNNEATLPPTAAAVFTKRITSPTSIVGSVHLKFSVRISTPQTDVVADVRKLNLQGKATDIGMWGSRVYRPTGAHKTVPLNFEIGPIFATFSPGEKLQVVFTSNLFPLAVRNTNSDLADYYKGFATAKVTILSSPENPSEMEFTSPVSPNPQDWNPAHWRSSLFPSFKLDNFTLH